MFATADQIALSIVMAAEAFGVDPIKVVIMPESSPARWHAVAALFKAFPDAPKEEAAKGCGFHAAKAARFAFRNLRANVVRQKWYRPELVDQIAAALSPSLEKPDLTISDETEVMPPAKIKPETRPAALPPTPQAAHNHNPHRPTGSRFGTVPQDTIARPSEDKSVLRRMLAEAAGNTAKAQEAARKG